MALFHALCQDLCMLFADCDGDLWGGRHIDISQRKKAGEPDSDGVESLRTDFLAIHPFIHTLNTYLLTVCFVLIPTCAPVNKTIMVPIFMELICP